MLDSKKGNFGNVQTNLKGAFGDSEAKQPILLFLTNTTDTYELIKQFY